MKIYEICGKDLKIICEFAVNFYRKGKKAFAKIYIETCQICGNLWLNIFQTYKTYKFLYPLKAL
ncbi:hypothetical protein B6A10_00675 [Flavobacterium sp. L1I52]|uniref:Uncharacterized protein n=1 Tax=Flavobacterium pokkalii TaxID=1940408 RepID=A0ABR7ULD3_9FLAO|nr:hypothetical protein [Flavobacterium pokkalii]